MSLLLLVSSPLFAAEPVPGEVAPPAPPTVTVTVAPEPWPHTTTVLKDGEGRDTIALLVNCFPATPVAGYIASQPPGFDRLAAALAQRSDKVVMMENPTAEEVRKELAAIVPASDIAGMPPRLYAHSMLVVTGVGWHGDLADDENPAGVLCRGFDVEHPNPDATVSLAEMATGMQAVATDNSAVLDASRRFEFPAVTNAEGKTIAPPIATLGPVAEDWPLDFALSPTGRRQFTGKTGFLDLLAATIEQMPEGSIMASDLVVAMRQRNTDASAPIVTKGELESRFLGAKQALAVTSTTAITRTPFPTKPVLRWSGVGLTAVGVGLEVAMIANLAPSVDCMSDPASCYGTKAEYDAAYGEYTATYDTWGNVQYVAPAVALTGVGLFVASFFIDPSERPAVTLSAGPTADGGVVALSGRW